jgi:hypothetical protein
MQTELADPDQLKKQAISKIKALNIQQLYP